MKLVKTKGIKLALVCGAAVGAFPFLFSLFLNFGEWTELISYTSAGLFMGFLMAPEIENKYFPRPVLFQTLCGLISGCIVAAVIDSPDKQVLSVLVFGVIGFTANMWVKYAPIP